MSLDNYVNFILEKVNNYKIIKNNKQLNNIKLKSEFVIYIIKDIPKSFTDLEKVIFIYIKLCNLLTHDINDLYKNSYTINHKNINRLKTIHINNNIIVCYEFVAIISKILDLFNIKYEIDGDNVYGRGHTYLKVHYNNSIICFDATRGLVNCDMTRTKNNIRVCNILPFVSSDKMLIELELSIDKVYSYIEKKYHKKYYNECEYINNNKINNLEYIDRIKVFLSKISKPLLPPMDHIKCIYLLKKMLFSNDELDITLTEYKYQKNKSKLLIIFTFNINGSYIYYTYEYPKLLYRIEKKKLENLLDHNIFKYIMFLKNDIPGINEKKLVK